MNQRKQHIQDHYGRIAQSGSTGCCSAGGPDPTVQEACCSPAASKTPQWYSNEEVISAPNGSNLGLGCGNPIQSAQLQEGEVVLDLGSGAGFDCFLAARQVGPEGRVIGVDFTPRMISRARALASKNSVKNVEFLLGEMERLPIPDKSVDVVISNCVINLSPDKQQVFHEVSRVLKPGGRLAIEDIIACIELPQEIKEDDRWVSACVGGAETIERLVMMMKDAGFVDIMILPKAETIDAIAEWEPGVKVRDLVASATLTARIPRECDQIDKIG